RRRTKEGEAGVALLLAVWVLALLAVLATAVTRDARSSLSLARNRVEVAQVRSLADAGAWEAVAALLDAERSKALFLDGRPQTLPLTGEGVRIAIQDESGKIDLNLAGEDRLKALFLVAGIPGDIAPSLAHTLVLYRAQREEIAARERKPDSTQPPAPVFLTKE